MLNKCVEWELKLVHFTEIKFRTGMKKNQDLDLKLVKGKEQNEKSHILSISCMPRVALILFKTILFYYVNTIIF